MLKEKLHNTLCNITEEQIKQDYFSYPLQVLLPLPKKVNARLIDLGETPVVEIEAYPVITDIKEMLEYDCKDSAEALPMMSKSLAMFDDDYVTKRMIEEFIIDEQDHYNWVKGHLCLIEQIGMENYIIEMLGD